MEAAGQELVLPCPSLDEAVSFFRDRLGFRLELVFPADDPRVAVLSGAGTRIRLVRAGADAADPPDVLPAARHGFVLTRGGAAGAAMHWKPGRAGMEYRDLIPDRQGGHVIASHIRIRDGGPVPDYVHFHRIRFQLLYCLAGWVRVVYEDQGPPLVMEAGDCVLQPPLIRHRVLECSPGLEVLELASPAEHATCVEHALELPTPGVRRERDFSGQRFVFARAAEAPWTPDPGARGWLLRDLGIGAATHGFAEARVARATGPASALGPAPIAGVLDAPRFLSVLRGRATLRCAGGSPEPIAPGDACVVPPHAPLAIGDGSEDLELLEVVLPDLSARQA